MLPNKKFYLNRYLTLIFVQIFYCFHTKRQHGHELMIFNLYVLYFHESCFAELKYVLNSIKVILTFRLTTVDITQFGGLLFCTELYYYIIPLMKLIHLSGVWKQDVSLRGCFVSNSTSFPCLSIIYTYPKTIWVVGF